MLFYFISCSSCSKRDSTKHELCSNTYLFFTTYRKDSSFKKEKQGRHFRTRSFYKHLSNSLGFQQPFRSLFQGRVQLCKLSISHRKKESFSDIKMFGRKTKKKEK